MNLNIEEKKVSEDENTIEEVFSNGVKLAENPENPHNYSAFIAISKNRDPIEQHVSISLYSKNPFAEICLYEKANGEYKITVIFYKVNEPIIYQRFMEAGFFSYCPIGFHGFNFEAPLTTSDPRLLVTFFQVLKSIDSTLDMVEKYCINTSDYTPYLPSEMPKWFLQEYGYGNKSQFALIYTAAFDYDPYVIRIGISTLRHGREMPKEGIKGLHLEPCSSPLDEEFDLCFQFHHYPMVATARKVCNTLFRTNYESIKRSYLNDLKRYDEGRDKSLNREDVLKEKLAITQRYFPVTKEVCEDLLTRARAWFIRYEQEKAEGLHDKKEPKGLGCMIM